MLSKGQREKKLNELKEKMYEKCGDEYELISKEYVNMRTKIKVKHNVCGTVFEVRPDAFFREKGYTRCPNKNCMKKRIEETTLKKFGYKCALSSPEVREKAKNTMKEKYGVESFFENGLIQEKMKEKYNVTSSNQMHINEPYSQIIQSKDQLKKWKEDFIKEEKSAPTLLDFCSLSGYSSSAVYKKFDELGFNIEEIFNVSSSMFEEKIKAFLDKNHISYQTHNRDIISPLELDFFIPDFNIAIETNGAFFHNSSIQTGHNRPPKERLYHQRKSLLCEDKGIRLIHIFEWDLYKKNIDNTLSFLESVFHINQKKIYARKCSLKDISSRQANDLYESNHLQGKTSNCKYNYGLFYNNQLVACMSFSKRKEEFFLTRFCSLKGTEIVGGASKLFSYFIKTVDPAIIISFSDITKMSGNVYKILGFKTEGVTAPSYWWYKNYNNIYWRRQCQKQYMHKLPGFDPTYKYIDHKDDTFWQRSEKEIMESKKYIQVFDSGMRKHVWRKEENDVRRTKDR